VHAILISLLRSNMLRFILGNSPRYTLDVRLCRAQVWSGHGEVESSVSGRSNGVRNCADWAILMSLHSVTAYVHMYVYIGLCRHRRSSPARISCAFLKIQKHKSGPQVVSHTFLFTRKRTSRRYSINREHFIYLYMFNKIYAHDVVLTFDIWEAGVHILFGDTLNSNKYNIQ
jgi:hypothetical protein